jgi:hypothetical protein
LSPLLVLAAFVCGPSGFAAEPKSPVAPLRLGGDLARIDVCKAIPRENIEAVMDRKLSAPPKPFEYYDAKGTNGCWYEARKDSSGEAHFGYVVMVPVEVYRTQPLYKNVAVSGLGQEAYFNNGGDARQLWVRMNEKVGFVVAFGDVPREAGAQALARLVAAAIR